MHDNTFQINRVIRYRNSFLPQIKGYFIDKNSHREIHIKMKLQSFVIVSLIFWIVFLVSIFSFKHESNKSKNDFKRIFNAKLKEL